MMDNNRSNLGIFETDEYFKSISYEFEAIKNRVRNLIGNKNWGEEGKYKERILVSTIEKILPEKYGIGTGFFIVVEERSSFKSIIPSSQIDILVYDSDSHKIFKDGNFVIVPAEAVKGIIEVKTRLTDSEVYSELMNAIIKLNRNGYLLSKSNPIGNRPPFIGLFSFSSDKRPELSEQVKANIMEKIKIAYSNSIFQIPDVSSGITHYNQHNKFMTGYICLNSDLFVTMIKPNFEHPDDLFMYDIEKLAPAFFIGNLISNSVNYYSPTLIFPQERKENRLFSSFVFNDFDTLENMKIRIESLSNWLEEIIVNYQGIENTQTYGSLKSRIFQLLTGERSENFTPLLDLIKNEIPESLEHSPIFLLINDLFRLHRLYREYE